MKSMLCCAQLCLTLCNSLDFSPPGSSYGICQARILGGFVISFLQGIFLNQGSNMHLLHCQAGSLSPKPPGKHNKIYTKNHSPARLYKDTVPSPGIRDELCHLVFRVVWGFVLSFLLNNCGHWATLKWVRSAWKYFSLKSKPSLPWQAFSWSRRQEDGLCCM